MKISVFNQQKSLKISLSLVKKQLHALVENEQIKCDEIALYFVSEKKIKALHKKYFNDPSSTDCISFPIDDPNDPKNPYCFLGEIFICTDIAIKYAKKHALNPYNEATLYLIHGFLHLIGFNDLSNKDKTIMQKKEKSCMSLLEAKKLKNIGPNPKNLVDKRNDY